MSLYDVIRFSGAYGYQIVQQGACWQPAIPGIPYVVDATGLPLDVAQEQVLVRVGRDRRCACAGCQAPRGEAPGG